MAKSIFSPVRPLYTDLTSRLEAHPWRQNDKEMCVERPGGGMAGPKDPVYSGAGLAMCAPAMPKPKPDTTRIMTRNQKELL